MRMDPEGIGGSACAKQNVLKVRANRASVIRQARGERSEIFIAGLQKELSARGRRVTLRAQKIIQCGKGKNASADGEERQAVGDSRGPQAVSGRRCLQQQMRCAYRHAQRDTSAGGIVNPAEDHLSRLERESGGG